ncbi:helix-turn-helix protein [Paenibacillus methanolicus]|uniref:Helix-turn-helix protein n=1 Tax=Paenibacillus methanolicus TaxID=582686 RepID=A0A5S5CGZ9_9BACL|nr:helix-turn-helix protein [Paenibacillus methanolicus]
MKASRADHGTKVNVIRNNAHKSLPRSTYYYKPETADTEEEQQLEYAIDKIFRNSRNNYGTREIKVELRKTKILASRRQIGQIMKKYGLVFNYTVAQYKPSKGDPDEAPVGNKLQREFQQDEPYLRSMCESLENGTMCAYLLICLTMKLLGVVVGLVKMHSLSTEQ